MNLRHATALVLVGWYLMAPPDSCPLLDGVPCSEPFSKWATVSSYDTAEACRQDLVSMWTFDRNQLKKLKQQDQSYSYRIWAVKHVNHSLCISTDDPRLKTN